MEPIGSWISLSWFWFDNDGGVDTPPSLESFVMYKCKGCELQLSGRVYLCDSCREARRRFCVDCTIELTGHGKPLRCKSCNTEKHMREGGVNFLRTPEALAKRSESMKRVCGDPDYRAEMSLNRRADWARGVYDDTFDGAHRKALSNGVKAAWARGDLYKLPTTSRRVSNLEIDVC